MLSSRSGIVEVAGAGPAGLAAAITIASAGRRVLVHEAHHQVGHRFQGDLQGLENWTDEEDVLDHLRRLGITTAFAHTACRSGTAFDARGRAYHVHSAAPVFYMVERGPGPATLDSAMLTQALALGVEVRFNDAVTRIDQPGILAIGPRAADAVAVGYHFETAMKDGFWVICNDRLAPGGYAYLLVMNGHGTIKSCMFERFRNASLYARRTVEAFERLVGLDMKNMRANGGVGNFRVPASGYSGPHPVAGEQAGFQDTLWGFGMRYAIVSGVLAARSLLDGSDYDMLWRREFGPLLDAAVVNRALYDASGERGHAWLLSSQEGTDARQFLRRLYHPTWSKRLISVWARQRYHSHRRDAACSDAGCTCVWCRCASGRAYIKHGEPRGAAAA